jgi:hypothetical protein
MNNWILYILLFIVYYQNCEFKWECQYVDKGVSSDSTTKSIFVYDKCENSNCYPLFNGVTFSKAYIDSISNDVLSIIDSTNKSIKINESLSDSLLTSIVFKIYKLDSIEIAHYKLDTISFKENKIVIHTFAYKIGDWNEDLAYYFLYSKEFGVFKKWKPGWWDADENYWLISNSCEPNNDSVLNEFVENYKKYKNGL